MDEVTGFATLFKGSEWGYGTEQGGCDKDTTLSYYERVIQHLEGDRPMGVYPLRAVLPGYDWEVCWGCVDFDEGEDKSLAYATNVAAVLHQFGVTGWIERSRSKGYHVWVFNNGWVPAVVMREALLAACQIVDAPTKEINPKSVMLVEGQLGNYVRLPYPGALAGDDNPYPPGRRVILGCDGEMDLVSFVEQALESRRDVTHLHTLQSLYVAPKRHVAPMPAVISGDMHKRMSGLAWTILQDGPKAGMGRGHTLYKLACLLREDGQHSQGEALALCIEADNRWGKFKHRTNSEGTIAQLVAKAWS